MTATADRPTRAPAARFVVRSLEQARLLANPFRLRLLHGLASRPQTVKQLAAQLGEPISRLYRHVHALEAAGLLRVAGQRPVRGTLEKRYVAAAREFEIDRALLRPGGGRSSLASSLVEKACEEVRACESLGSGRSARAIVLRAQFRARPQDLPGIQRSLREWVAAQDRRRVGTQDAQIWTATFALYPAGSLRPTKRR